MQKIIMERSQKKYNGIFQNAQSVWMDMAWTA